MDLSYSWLKEYVSLSQSPHELSDALTMSGTEVEGIRYLGEGIELVVTARILAVAPVAGAERLRACDIDYGTGRCRVVTAADNVKAGDVVPVALVGARLPGGKVIGRAEFHGTVSEGMLVSGQELGLEKESAGILVLDTATAIGLDIRGVVGLDDWTIDASPTPNRPDCLCMVGIARELSALTGAELTLPSRDRAPATGSATADMVSVDIQAPDLCPRYVAKIVHDVVIGPSPAWMQQRLRAVGVRPINNVVDVTNYVMLEMNQPLHAFDYDQVAGHTIVVRRAKAGEVMATLDGSDRPLDEGMLLICDAERPVALAGVMGGLNSEVTEATTTVLLESACFSRVSVWRTSKDVRLRTEASVRFEKGLDPENCHHAIERAAALLHGMGAGSPAPGIVDEYPVRGEGVSIELRPARASAMLGCDIQPRVAWAILASLGFGVVGEPAGPWTVAVPSFRGDVTQGADLIEEIGRVYGYDKVEATLPRSTATVGGISRSMAIEDACASLLAGCGFSEVLTYAFVSPRIADRLHLPADSPLRDFISLTNPLTEEFSVMRTSLLGSLLEVAERNANRRATDLALFESARVYLKGDPVPEERRVLAALAMGSVGEPTWNRSRHEMDFHDMKGVALAVLADIGVSQVELVRSAAPAYHPGRSADLSAGGHHLGTVGEVHPQVASEFDLPKRAYAFELDLSAIGKLARSAVSCAPLPRFPAMRRDLAVVVAQTRLASDVEAVIRREGGPLLESIALFDVYTGQQVPEGWQSMAYAITYRHPDRTLTDDEVATRQTAIEGALVTELGAQVRA